MTLVPRPYQLECEEAVRSGFARDRSLLVVLATGTGKTEIGILVATAQAARGRVLWLTHLDTLADQTARRFQARTGRVVGVEKAEKSAGKLDQVVVASVPSLKDRLRAFRPGDWSLVVCDEAHHAPSASWKKVIDHFRQSDGCRVLGLTATPIRQDKKAMGKVFDRVAYAYHLLEATDDGWLVPMKPLAVKLKSLDFTHLYRSGKWEKPRLDQILAEERSLHEQAARIHQAIGDRPMLAYCASVAHAKLLAVVLGRSAYGSIGSGMIDAKTGEAERGRILEEFRLGSLRRICNYGIFGEGFDAPWASAVALLRRFSHVSTYLQAAGRGVRPLPGLVDGLPDADARREAIERSAKPSCLVIDLIAARKRHSSLTDLLGGSEGEVEANEWANGKRDMREISALVRDENEFMKLWRQEMRSLQLEERLARTGDARDEIGGIAETETSESGFSEIDEKCTSRQAWYLLKHFEERGEHIPIERVKQWSKSRATREIIKIKARQQRRRPT